MCCRACFERAESLKAGDGAFWVLLCAESAPDGWINAKNTKRVQNALKRLEKARYVISHETDTALIIKVQGIGYVDSEESEGSVCVVCASGSCYSDM